MSLPHVWLGSRFHQAIIDGVTRDTRETSDIQFPVLSKGRYCKDTRRRGIVTSKNRSVVIDGVTIRKNDLIFADSIDNAVRESPIRELPKVRSWRGVLFEREARRAPKDLRDATFILLQELIS